MVDDDADAESLLLADTSLLDLGNGETTTDADLGVVTDGRAADGRTEELKRAGSEVESLLLAVHPPPVLAAGLVEPRLDAALFRVSLKFFTPASRHQPANPCLDPSAPDHRPTCKRLTEMVVVQHVILAPSHLFVPSQQ